MKKQGITPTVILTGIITLVVIGMVVVFLNSAGFSSWVKNLPTWGDDSDVVVVSTDYTGGDRSIPETEGGYKECKYVVGRIQGGGGKLAVTNLAESSTSELELDDLFLINQGEDLDLSLKVAWVDRENLNGYLIYSSDDLLYGLLPGTPGRFKLGAISNGIISLSSTPEAIDIVATARSTPRLDLSVLNGAFIGNENKICRDTNLQLDSLMLARIEMGKLLANSEVLGISKSSGTYAGTVVSWANSGCFDFKSEPVKLKFVSKKFLVLSSTREEISFWWDAVEKSSFISGSDGVAYSSQTLKLDNGADHSDYRYLGLKFKNLKFNELALIWSILESNNFEEFVSRVSTIIESNKDIGIYLGDTPIYKKFIVGYGQSKNVGYNLYNREVLFSLSSDEGFFAKIPPEEIGNFETMLRRLFPDIFLESEEGTKSVFSIYDKKFLVFKILYGNDYYANWLAGDARCSKYASTSADFVAGIPFEYTCSFGNYTQKTCWKVGSLFCIGDTVEKAREDADSKTCLTYESYTPDYKFFISTGDQTFVYQIRAEAGTYSVISSLQD